MLRWTIAIALLFATAASASADEVVLTGAGSLREVMTDITTRFAQAQGVTVRTDFGPSGRMRARIEGGEHVDVFTSADVGHAGKLVADGRASVMAVFTRNTLCLLSPAGFGATRETALDRLLAPGVRIGVSPARIDPLGDYTVRLFEVAETRHPGAQAALADRAVVIDTPPGTPPPRSGDDTADAVQDGRIDAAIVYCSARGRYARLLPDATVLTLPAWLQVGPEYALAVLRSAPPAALLLALTILSPEGQAALAARGFQPLGLPTQQAGAKPPDGALTPSP